MDDRFSFLRQEAPSSARPVNCSFHHRVKGSEGEVALQYWPPARGSRRPPEHIIVFILGNPGLLNYYHPFLSHLHYLLPPSHAILSTSHIGHSPHIPAPILPLSLHEQLEAKVELLSSLRRYTAGWAEEGYRPTPRSRFERVDRPRISLMGHSVGSWFLLEMMKRLGDEVEAGYMLFPTLGWIADSWNGRKLWPIFHRPLRPLLPYITYLVRPILPLLTHLPATTLSLLRSPTTVEHVLHLSRSEMDHILSPDLASIRALSSTKMGEGRGLFGIWAGGNLDGWVGREGEMVQSVMGGEGVDGGAGGRVVVVDGIPHAFCLSRTHSHYIAELVAAWIDPSLANAGGSESDASDIISVLPM
ncbi:uncharacterized protein MKK02DRAFT_39828 [Dioszegia hungarica]|uniref:Lipid droplet-associated hydrolase n=1 Tax=Dioszegia hungarica TaxID=4972 RepID=A0AA38HHT3_9TREE|nr:uncharacterized protein MKK02DRAFT_39828 [Dioszegia hungarica]KAI9639519.1 hypothetical protein MKK02DRAFT_39828 [Dioszegia hungarica]